MYRHSHRVSRKSVTLTPIERSSERHMYHMPVVRQNNDIWCVLHISLVAVLWAVWYTSTSHSTGPGNSVAFSNPCATSSSVCPNQRNISTLLEDTNVVFKYYLRSVLKCATHVASGKPPCAVPMCRIIDNGLAVRRKKLVPRGLLTDFYTRDSRVHDRLLGAI